MLYYYLKFNTVMANFLFEIHFSEERLRRRTEVIARYVIQDICLKYFFLCKIQHWSRSWLLRFIHHIEMNRSVCRFLIHCWCRAMYWATKLCNRGFESRSGHGCLSTFFCDPCECRGFAINWSPP